MKRQRRRGGFLTGSVAVVLAIASAPVAWAQTTWTGGHGTYWSDPGNWTIAVPTLADTAILNTAGGYRPTLDVASSVGTLNMSAGTLILGGRTLTAGTVNLTGGTITGTGTLSVGTLNINGGSIENSATIAADDGTINLFGWRAEYHDHRHRLPERQRLGHHRRQR